MSENEVTRALEKDVRDGGLLLTALPEGDELAGYQVTLVIRRQSGQYEAAHSAYSFENDRASVGEAIVERTAASWQSEG